jgi:hypothetical protein
MGIDSRDCLSEHFSTATNPIAACSMSAFLSDFLCDFYSSRSGFLFAGLRSVSVYTRSRTRFGWSVVGQVVLKIPAQPIELPHHDGVSLADVLHESRQAWAVVVGARHGVGEGLISANRVKCCSLLIEGLGDRADADLADAGGYPYWRRCSQGLKSVSLAEL